MVFRSSTSTDADSPQAIEHVCREVASGFEGRRPDLAILFASQHHSEHLEEMVETLRARVRPGTLLGCTGDGIIGGGQELEGQPGVSLWVASLPGAQIVPFHLMFRQTPEGIGLLGWPDDMKFEGENPAFLILAEPYSSAGTELLAYLHDKYPGVPAVGGMASGGIAPGQNRVILDGQVLDEGAVGIALSGPVGLQTVVSQGCRPIGDRFLITRAESNVIFELGGKSALECLQQVYAALSPEEQNLARQGLHIGYAIDEHKSEFDRGDFLVRNVVGADQESGSIVVTDLSTEGQTVQFHVRDRETASEDLRWLLTTRENRVEKRPVAGALLFSCNGRGQRLFGVSDHDVTAVRKQVGDVPLAGFFAQGEIGPVGGRNFLHGFTASVALFTEPADSD